MAGAPAPIDASKGGVASLLFTKAETPVYAVLDGAASPAVVKLIYAKCRRFFCLRPGNLAPDIAVVSPYIVQLEPESEFTATLLKDGWGVNWGMFFTSPAKLQPLRDHFRKFRRAELPDRRIVLFRFHDPRVLRTFLPVCNAAELREFFGPVQTLLVEGATPETGVMYSLPNGALKTEPFQLKKPA